MLFTACDPMEDIYDDIKNNEKPYFETGIEYTLTDNDYSYAASLAKESAQTAEDSAWADYIVKYSAFNKTFSAYTYIPEILAVNFPALKDSSDMLVNFNQYVGEMYGEIKSAELTDDDYIEIGGDIAANLYFSDESELDSLSGYLSGKFPDAEAGTYAEVFYRYPDSITTAGGFYKFNGFIWTEVENSRVLVPADYDAMGEPGNYNNFSEDALPQNYLPQFLRLEYPYAQQGDMITVICDLYKFERSIYAIPCEFDGSDWNVYFPGENTSAQFRHDEEKWYFDPTMIFTMSSSDYQLLVDYVTGNPDIPNGYLDSYHPETSEYYYGANSYYNNFYIKLYKRRQYDPLGLLDGLSDEDALSDIWRRVKEGIVIMLQQKFPDAVPSVGGIDVHYFITFKTHGETDEYYKIEYKCASEGTPPSFEMVSDTVNITKMQ